MPGAAGRQDIPVAVGIATIAPFGGPFVDGQMRFGESGPFSRTTHPPAVDFILEQIRRFPGQITLATIGPLTNIGALIDKDPQTFRRLKRVVMMGCWINPFVDEGITVRPGPETNIVLDISAAKKLFQPGVPIYVMPTDATWNLKLDEVKRRTLWDKGTPLTDSLAPLYLLWGSGSGTPILWDAMAVAYVVDPQLCPVEPMHVVIDDKGGSQSGPGAPNAQVCLHPNAETFFKKLEVWPDGSAIEIEQRDIHISVHGLIVALLPAMLSSRVIAAVFASRGGQSTSVANPRGRYR